MPREITFIYDGEKGEVICPDPDYWHYVLLGKISPEIARANDELNKKFKIAGGYTCG